MKRSVEAAPRLSRCEAKAHSIHYCIGVVPCLLQHNMPLWGKPGSLLKLVGFWWIASCSVVAATPRRWLIDIWKCKIDQAMAKRSAYSIEIWICHLIDYSVSLTNVNPNDFVRYMVANGASLSTGRARERHDAHSTSHLGARLVLPKK